jgi:L-2-hydroxyglutarate oxidase
VNCAGLHADRVARLTGISGNAGMDGAPRPSIVPFRGEYYELRPEARSLVNHLIYPVPAPSFPFLGVHFTRMVDRDEHGHRVECGPNAVLAFAREGHTKTRISPGDLAEVLSNGSFWRLAARHWKTGLGEMHRSWSKAAFTRALQRLLPDITAEDLVPARAGVRAQALGPGGRLLDDFAIERSGPIVNVINAPSPAATASLAIAERICDLILGGSAENGRRAAVPLS